MVTTRRRKSPRRRSKTSQSNTQESNSRNLGVSPVEYVREAARADPVIFAENNLLSERGDPLEYYKQHDFLKQYLRDFSPEIAVIKSSQVGITTTAMVKVLYLAHLDTKEAWKDYLGISDNRSIRVIYTFPTEKDVSDFSSTRFGTMVRQSPLLIKLMGGNKGVNATLRKSIGNSIILFRGTTKESQAISQPADLIVNDELDFSNQEVVDAFDSRLSHSRFKWWWKFSTPTIPNFGIDAEYTNSNQYNWIIKCKRCGRHQTPLYPDHVKRRKFKGKFRNYWACEKCGKELDRTTGEWIASYPTRKNVGYRIPPSICPWIQPDNITASRKRYRSEKLFNNYALGRAYATGADVLTRDMLLKRIEYGRGYHNIDDRLVYMGVDQGDVLHYIISRGSRGRREIIEIGNCTSFDDIAFLMRKYNVISCVMDALPNKKTAQQFSEDFAGRVNLAFYKDFDEDADVKPTKNMEVGLTLDRTNTLDMAADSWRMGETVMVLDKDRYARIPTEIDNPQDKTAFIQQMGNMVRDEKLNERTQKSRFVWVATGADHYRHADNYNYIAWRQQQADPDAFDNMSSEPIFDLQEVGGVPMYLPGSTSGFWTDF